jgi:hypothetical protein
MDFWIGWSLWGSGGNEMATQESRINVACVLEDSWIESRLSLGLSVTVMARFPCSPL